MADAFYKKYSDEELLSLVLRDDRAAFEYIYEKYASKLYASAYNLLRDKHICEDLIQELFIDLWVKRQTLQVYTVKAYLYTAARNRVLMAVRSGRAHLDISVVETLAAQYTTGSKIAENEINRLLDCGIETLPKKCREIFLLSRKEQLSNKEIADRLNISTKTVENQITIAIRKMKVEMGDYLALALIFHLLR